MKILKKLKLHRQIKKAQKTNKLDRKLDIQEILSMEYSDGVVIDAYEYCMKKCGYDISALDKSSVKDFLLCVIFEDEVANGGISQFLSNSSGDLWKETVFAMEKVNGTVAKLLKEASQYFPNGIVPKDRDTRNDLMVQFDEKIEEQFEKLDRLLWKHPLSQSCYTFLQTHKDDFLYF